MYQSSLSENSVSTRVYPYEVRRECMPFRTDWTQLCLTVMTLNRHRLKSRARRMVSSDPSVSIVDLCWSFVLHQQVAQRNCFDLLLDTGLVAIIKVGLCKRRTGRGFP